MVEDVGRVVDYNNRNYLLVARIHDGDFDYVYLMSEDSPLEVIIAKEEVTSMSLTQLSVIEDEVERERIYKLFLKWANFGVL